MAGSDVKSPPLSILSGRGVNKWKSVCQYCQREEVVAAKHNREGQAKNKLISKGWTVTRAGMCTCPACLAKFRAFNVKKKKEPKMKEKQPAAAAQEISIAEKRKITKEVSLHYRDDGRGYSGSETDATIAKRCGVPVSWVEKIRSENFGSVGFAGDIEAMQKSLSGLRSNLKTVESTAYAALENAERYKAQIDLISQSLSELLAE